ncbi:hypothetical protein VTN00DRAFT_5544 [Thermoascus crustaceus]|uniref:uncharacterized protein n=1 Tax=Thermoascus crustaceus TaxID=5088 RepID=UPI003743634A
MGKLNYSARKIDGLKAGQVLSKDLRKRLPPGTASKAAARDPHLEIDISAKELTDDGFARFIDDLVACLEYRDKDHPDGVVRLTELHLQRNVLTARSLRKLARVIALSAGDLRELDLSSNEIEISNPEQREIWQEFLQSFSGCYMLKKLDLSRNPLGPRGLEILSRVYMQSDLDFLETDVNDVVEATATTAIETADEDCLNDRVSVLRLENGKENERLSAVNFSKKTPSKSKPSRQSRVQSLSPGEKIVTQADIKRFSCTRGLRSIPYLIISSVSMTNACAVHLASILSIHRSPEQLLAFLPGGKALTLPDIVGQCKGIVWLPNRDLGPLAQKLLEMTEMFRDWTSDTESDDELAEEIRSPSKAAGNPLAVQSPLNKADITKQRQVRKKLDIEYVRLTKRVRIDILKVEGVHSADIWSTALKMMVTCRALLLEDKDRRGDAATGGEEIILEHPEEPEESINPEMHIPGSVSAASRVGPFHPSTEDFAMHFPTIQGASATTMTPTRPQSKEAENITPPSQTQATRSGKGHARTTPGASAPAKKETWRFGLPMELWRRIIADALGAEGILNQEQQLQTMRYASDWNALAYELTIKGAAEHQQIWKILDSINCFTYNPTW